MIDIKLVRENPDFVKANIKKKFQDHKLVLVDEVIDLDKKNRAAITKVEGLRAERTKLSKQIGVLMASGKKDEAEEIKAQSQKIGDEIVELEKEQEVLVNEHKEPNARVAVDINVRKFKKLFFKTLKKMP